MNDKFLSLLGFATKSGNLSFGMSAAIKAVKTGKSKLVLVCFDISKKSLKEITFHCENSNVKAIILDNYSIQTVTDAVGRKCGIVSVNDSSFADAVLKTAEIGGIANDK